MPLVCSMSSYSCCIQVGGYPPSPDALPPRPVELSKDHLPVMSWSAASRLSGSGGVAELRTLFGGSDIDEEEHRVPVMKKSSSTLNAMKSKLKKHFSRESALSKRQPRSTVGNSDEEVERRKELKLIRDRRIQRELSSEDSYDDDAKSLSTLATGKFSCKAPKTLIVEENIPGPVETDPLPQPLLRKSDDGFYMREPSTVPSIKRRHSLTALDSPKILVDAIRSQCSTPSTPSTPKLEPQRLPSIVDSATRRASWRLSFASDQRATHLRALSQEHMTFPSNTDSIRQHNSVDPLRWFRGQGFRTSPFAAITLSDYPSGLDSLRSQVALHPDLGGCEDVDGCVDGNAELLVSPVSLQDMQISKRLASRDLHSHSSSPQLSSWGSKHCYLRRSHVSDASNRKAKSEHYHSTSSSGITDSKFPSSWGDVLRDGVSSIYPSAGNSVKLTSESSRFSLPSLLGPKKAKVSSQGSDSQGDTTTVIQTPPAIAITSTSAEVTRSTDAINTSQSKQDRRFTGESSIFLSETPSFRQREAELDVIKTRFPKTMQKSGPTTPTHSKFNEDFSELEKLSPTSLREKSHRSLASRIPRIYKLMSKSYDGASLFELQAPTSRQGYGYSFSNRSHSTAGSVSPGGKSPGTKTSISATDPLQVQDDTEGVWTQALKRTQEEYKAQISAELSSVGKERKDNHGSLLTTRSVSWKLKGKEKAGMDFSKEVERDGMLIEGRDFELKRELCRQARGVEKERTKADEWADELEARERQARAKTTAVGKGSPPPVRMPPESWARFPSHTRDERTASAGLQDNVSPKDFAIKDIKDGVVDWMKGDRRYHHHHHQKEQHHSLPIRVSKQIRTSLYKLRASKSTFMSDAIQGRKSSVSVGGKLEYPELEILGGEIAGNELYEEVERETEAEMRRNERAARMVVFSDGSVDEEANSEEHMSHPEVGEIPLVSIADPKFYEDCVTLPQEEDDDNDKTSERSRATIRIYDWAPLEMAVSKREKHSTWSGGYGATNTFTDSSALRRSTVDFQVELEMMESLERDRAIRSAEAAWGSIRR